MGPKVKMRSAWPAQRLGPTAMLPTAVSALGAHDAAWRAVTTTTADAVVQPAPAHRRQGRREEHEDDKGSSSDAKGWTGAHWRDGAMVAKEGRAQPAAFMVMAELLWSAKARGSSCSLREARGR
jgi:hypothetical protein